MGKFEKKKLLRIFICESDKFNNGPLYLALLELFREKGISGATVLRGIAGYGLHNVVHTDRILRLSGDLPIVVEAVDSVEKIMELLPGIEELAVGGLVTMEDIEVLSMKS